MAVTVSSNHADVTIDGPDADSTFTQSEALDNFIADWDTPQTITIKGAEDADVLDLSAMLTLTAGEPAGRNTISGYAGITKWWM